MHQYQIAQTNNWNRLYIYICIRLGEEIRSSELITSAWLQAVMWKPHKRQSRIVSYCGQHRVRQQKPWRITTIARELSAIINAFCEMPQAVCLFAVRCRLSQRVCSFLCSHSKSITLISLDNGVSTETNLFCACSMGVGYECSDIASILTVPINPATAVQVVLTQGQLNLLTARNDLQKINYIYNS